MLIQCQTKVKNYPNLSVGEIKNVHRDARKR